MEISSDFNNLSFHDALVNCVCRHDDRIEIEFNFVIVTPEHSIANGDVIELKNINVVFSEVQSEKALIWHCLLYTSPSPRDLSTSRMPSSA